MADSAGLGALQVEDLLYFDNDAENTGALQRFVAMSASVRLQFAVRYARTPRLFHGEPLVHILLAAQPQFLMLAEPWVDILLLTESNIGCSAGMNCLLHLLQS